jgi:ubiquitin carboxyl-terminal hydrolase MINDY-1/2
VTIEELTSVLAEKILLNHHTGNNDHHINEVMKIFPNLQFGMDVNPKFTAGPTGVEYTMELNAFDLLSIELVHGWLLEPDAQEYEWVGNNTYNQLVNIVIQGNDASAALQQNPNVENHDQLSHQATQGSVIHHFLERSGHQLTQYGLQVLHEYVKEGDMVVFFRNNHFNTLTKYEGHLYLLVTDFGYADVASVVWEKLDVIDGDTEYVDGQFKVPPPVKHHVSSAATGEQMVANNLQANSDYQLALQLSRETEADANPSLSSGAASTTTPNKHPSKHDLEMEQAKQASLLEQQQQLPMYEQPRGDEVMDAHVSAAMAPSIKTTTTTTTTTVTTTSLGKDTPVDQHSQPTVASIPKNILAPNVSVGIPITGMSQEDRDRMLALQLQRQEEEDRKVAIETERATNAASEHVARVMQQEEENARGQYQDAAAVARPSPMRAAHLVQPQRAKVGGSKENGCVIS